MKIRDLMTKDVTTCKPSEALDDVVQRMDDENCGCLPVVSETREDEVIGMLTDRDVCLAARRAGKSLKQIRVSDAMSPDVHVCRPDDSHAEATRVMREGRVRRIPVVEGGKLHGLLSLAHLARASTENTDVSPEEIGLTLAAICEPMEAARATP